jgi:hypothetical protein
LSLSIAIVGAGDLGGVLASVLAARGRVGEIRLIDEAGSAAVGKALDIQQSLPVHGTAVRLTGSLTLDAVDDAHIVVLADAFGPPSREHAGEAGLVLVRRLAARAATAPVVFAGASHAWLVEKAVTELGLPWTRVIGAAALAVGAAVRALVGLEAGVSPLDVQVAITGLPPANLVVAWESATIGRAALTAHLDLHARARVAKRLPLLWPPGPMTLAAAAVELVEAMTQGGDRPHTALLALDAMADAGPSQRAQSRRVIAADAWLTRAGVARVTLPDLSIQERLALDNVRLRQDA